MSPSFWTAEVEGSVLSVGRGRLNGTGVRGSGGEWTDSDAMSKACHIESLVVVWWYGIAVVVAVW
jgi:hypothetical protein